MIDPIFSSLGENVRAWRSKRGWSQEKLAEESGLHRTYIGALERGQRNVSVRNIARLAKALQITSAELLAGVDLR